MKSMIVKSFTRIFLAVFACLASATAADEFLLKQGWQAVGNARLDAQRGGFTTPSGINISLGIAKTVTVDGVLYSVTTLNVPDLTNMLPSEFHWETSLAPDNTGDGNGGQEVAVLTAPALDAVAQAGMLVGDITKLVSEAGTIVMNYGFDTLIQNSMDGRTIQVKTIIDANVSILDSYREIGLLDRINERLIHAMD